jgi:hypothetical protein
MRGGTECGRGRVCHACAAWAGWWWCGLPQGATCACSQPAARVGKCASPRGNSTLQCAAARLFCESAVAWRVCTWGPCVYRVVCNCRQPLQPPLVCRWEHARSLFDVHTQPLRTASLAVQSGDV